MSRSEPTGKDSLVDGWTGDLTVRLDDGSLVVYPVCRLKINTNESMSLYPVNGDRFTIEGEVLQAPMHYDRTYRHTVLPPRDS